MATELWQLHHSPRQPTWATNTAQPTALQSLQGRPSREWSQRYPAAPGVRPRAHREGNSPALKLIVWPHITRGLEERLWAASNPSPRNHQQSPAKNLWESGLSDGNLWSCERLGIVKERCFRSWGRSVDSFLDTVLSDVVSGEVTGVLRWPPGSTEVSAQVPLVLETERLSRSGLGWGLDPTDVWLLVLALSLLASTGAGFARQAQVPDRRQHPTLLEAPWDLAGNFWGLTTWAPRALGNFPGPENPHLGRGGSSYSWS